MRRILIILAVIIVLLGIGGFVYWRYFSTETGLAVSDTPDSALPDSEATSTGGTDAPVRTDPALPQVTRVTSRLTKIAAGPVAPGVAVVVLPAASASSSSSPSTGSGEVSVRFVERESGNIFSYLARTGTLTRTSNKTLPGVQKATWLPSGQTAFVTYLSGATLSTVDTYGLSADGSGGFFLPKGIVDIAVSSTSVLTLASGATGSVASLRKTDGTGSVTAFTSPLSALRIGFAGKQGYIAFTKPTQSLGGSVFFVSPSGIFSRLAGPLPGLVALANHSGSMTLVSSANSGVMSLALVDTATGARVALPLRTIADKCVWTADDTTIYCGVPVSPSTAYGYPDDWYQGAAHFSDRVWKIDVKGRFTQLVLTPSSETLDVEAPALDPGGSLLVFTNKNDGSLWSYQL
jgi:hypothetical protein